MSELDFVYSIWINSTPEKIWEAITSPEFTKQYWHNSRVKSTWEVGASVDFMVDGPDGKEVSGCTGKVLKCDPFEFLSFTWLFPLNPEYKDEDPSTVSFEIFQKGKMCRLTVRHFNFPEKSKLIDYVSEGWPLVICGMKTLIETGQAFDYSAEWEG